MDQINWDKDIDFAYERFEAHGKGADSVAQEIAQANVNISQIDDTLKLP